jgi:hypothetical protein
MHDIQNLLPKNIKGFKYLVSDSSLLFQQVKLSQICC